MPERLLDHEQVKSVELFQVLDLVERIGGIGIATEHDLRPTGADFLEDLDVPARFALDLDAAVAGIQFGVDFFQQLFVRVLDADGNATGNFFAAFRPEVAKEEHCAPGLPHPTARFPPRPWPCDVRGLCRTTQRHPERRSIFLPSNAGARYRSVAYQAVSMDSSL